MARAQVPNQAVLEELNRINEAAFNSYDQKDATGFRYKKLDRPVLPTSQASALESFDKDLGYKQPRKQAFYDSDPQGQTFSAEDLKKEPVWSSHYDEDYDKLYYYNRLTKKSEWDKPAKFDGYEIMSGQASMFGQDSEYQRTFGGGAATSFSEIAAKKPLEDGALGGWEEVTEEDDYYKQNSIAKLDDEKRNEYEKMGQESRALTVEEVLEESDNDSI